MSIGGKNQFILKKVIVMNTFLIFIMHTNPILNLITFWCSTTCYTNSYACKL